MPDISRRARLSTNATGGTTTTLKPYDKDNGQAGIIAPTHCLGSSTALVLTASRAYVARFVPSRNMTIVSISFVITTAAGTDDACDVGIYNSALTTKLVSAGATTGKLNGLGIQTVTITATPLTAGTVYYAAMSVGTFGGTVPQVAMSALSAVGVAGLFGTTAGLVEQANEASAHPLAASITPTVGLASVPMLALRET